MGRRLFQLFSSVSLLLLHDIVIATFSHCCLLPFFFSLLLLLLFVVSVCEFSRGRVPPPLYYTQPRAPRYIHTDGNDKCIELGRTFPLKKMT